MANDQPILFARQMMDPDNANIIEETIPTGKPLVSLVIPAYNEAAVVQQNLAVLCDYMKSLEYKYDWEMIVVNDGSKDDTSLLAKSFAASRSNVFVLDHVVNFGLGQALKFAFNECRGDYIVTVDMDLSYSPDHIDTAGGHPAENRGGELYWPPPTWPAARWKMSRPFESCSASGPINFSRSHRMAG